jgi:hypothetical protein
MRHLQLPKVSLGRPNRPTIATEDLSLADVIDGYADGRYLPTDAVGACLDRIARYEPFTRNPSRPPRGSAIIAAASRRNATQGRAEC